MNLVEIVEILDARIKYLGFLRTQAALQGDIERVASLDIDIAESVDTKAQLDTLI